MQEILKSLQFRIIEFRGEATCLPHLYNSLKYTSNQSQAAIFLIFTEVVRDAISDSEGKKEWLSRAEIQVNNWRNILFKIL
jgi:hypothetical protein